MKKWLSKYDWGTFEIIWDKVSVILAIGGYIWFIWLICEKLFG